MTAIHIPKAKFVPYKCRSFSCATEIVHFDVKDKIAKDCPDCEMPLKRLSIIHLLVPDKEKLWIINCEEGRRNKVEQWTPNHKDAGPDYPYLCSDSLLAATCFECLHNFDKLLAETSEEDLQKLYQYSRLKTQISKE